MTVALLVPLAQDVARDLLGAQPQRWAHTQGVGRRSEELVRLANLDDAEAEVLVAAGWLHDVGYAPRARRTGFPPLDGALHLEHEGWPDEITQLVAHHSGARFVADVHGLSEELAHFAVPGGRALDLLSYADQTVGPAGLRVRVEDRIDDTLRRHGPDSPSARAHARRGPYLLETAARMRALLRGWS